MRKIATAGEIIILITLIVFAIWIVGGVKISIQANPIIKTSESSCFDDLAPNPFPEKPVGDAPSAMANIIPKPVSVNFTHSSFSLASNAQIFVNANSSDIKNAGDYLAGKINSAIGTSLTTAAEPSPIPPGNIDLTTQGSDPSWGKEGYTITIDSSGIVVRGLYPEGVFRGSQTLLQMFALSGSSSLPTGEIMDYPRFPYRGIMIDVARHFYSISDLEKLIDDVSLYKINCFHIHLTDGEGWRIEIKSRPNLTNGGDYYTQKQFKDLIDYAKKRSITIIPEIDMPGHMTAACNAYPLLNCVTWGRYLNMVPNNPETFNFVNDVAREIATLSPYAYVHIGTDESKYSTDSNFLTKLQKIFQSYGRNIIAWNDSGSVSYATPFIIEHWTDAHNNFTQQAFNNGARIIMSPWCPTYFANCTLDVMQSYQWDPENTVPGVSGKNVIGFEGSLWEQSGLSYSEHLIFPRIIDFAEIGWSPTTNRSWNEYCQRLQQQLQQPKPDILKTLFGIGFSSAFSFSSDFSCP